MKIKFTLSFFILFNLIAFCSHAQTVTVIFHVIHSGQAVGTYPNLSQAQINSQLPVLNNDYAGIGYNTGTYPANAFTAWATNTFIAASSLDGFGRIAIANTGITFKMATTDTLGNILAEPGIERIDCNTIPGSYSPSKNPGYSGYTSASQLMNLFDNYIKPNTTWNCSNYLNIWISDARPSVGILGYTPFPPGTTLPGILAVSSRTTDGVWAWAKCVGDINACPTGTYAAPYVYGRTLTHEIGHHFGLLHLNTCSSTDYVNDTPPNGSSSIATPTCGVPSYPLNVGSCTSPVSNSPDGEMFMNFMGFSEDCAMYMFTQDQVNRMTTAIANSPYLNKLGIFSTGIKEINAADLKIYPNPTSGLLTVFSPLKGTSAVGADGECIEVFNLIGERIYKTQLTGDRTEIDLSSQRSGIYFVKVGTAIRKIIKE